MDESVTDDFWTLRRLLSQRRFYDDVKIVSILLKNVLKIEDLAIDDIRKWSFDLDWRAVQKLPFE